MAGKSVLRRVNGRVKEVLATQTSAGVGNAGDVVALSSTGYLDASVLPPELGLDVKLIVASENISASSLVNVFDAGSGVFKVRNADASVEGKEATGFVKESVVTAASVNVFGEGMITGLTGLTPGRVYLDDAVAGGITQTPVTGAGKVHQYLGNAISATELNFVQSESITLAS